MTSIVALTWFNPYTCSLIWGWEAYHLWTVERKLLYTGETSPCINYEPLVTVVQAEEQPKHGPWSGVFHLKLVMKLGGKAGQHRLRIMFILIKGVPAPGEALSTFPHSLFFLLASFLSPPASVCPSVAFRQGYSPGSTWSPPSAAANLLISLNISTQISMPPAPVCSVSFPGSILAAHFPQWVYLKLCFFSYLLIMSFASATEIPATGHVCTYLQDLHLLMRKLRTSVSVDFCHLFAHRLSCHDSLTWTSLAWSLIHPQYQ